MRPYRLSAVPHDAAVASSLSPRRCVRSHNRAARRIARAGRVCAAVFAVLALLASGCGDDGGAGPGTSANNANARDAGGDGGGDVQQLPLQAALVDTQVVAGGPLRLEVTGAELLIPRDAWVTWEGAVDGAPVSVETAAVWEKTDAGLTVEVPWEAISGEVLGGGAEGRFEGALGVRVTDLGDAVEGVGQVDGVAVDVAASLAPELSPAASLSLFLNDVSLIDASGLLRPGEGASVLVVSGTFRDGEGVERDVQAEVPMMLGPGGRAQAQVRWPAYVFGIRPGTFDGTVQVRNDHALSDAVSGTAHTVAITLQPTEVDSFSPSEGSRGQVVSVLGRGLIPADTDFAQSMFFILDGSFRRADGSVVDLSGDNVLRLAPDEVPDHTEARIILRSQTEDGPSGQPALTGLTATPGQFMGTVTPALVSGSDTVLGRPFQGTLTIAPTEQVVFLKFLPGFNEALERFGLRNVEPELRDRIFDVIQRDYRDFNLRFTDQRPDDFAEYCVIEIGGSDPNGAGLFGLDNTAGKDTGNLRLDDIIGGSNAESQEQGFFAFGGVFIDSFVAFSPSLDPGSPAIDPAFDTIFAPFMPELGGQPVDAAEWPGGPRQAEINDAIAAMGSVIGNTITHEIGHSLGLTFYEEDLTSPGARFHNEGDTPGAIMDGGQDRPFDERAELEGAPAPFFTEANRDYLKVILPRP